MTAAPGENATAAEGQDPGLPDHPAVKGPNLTGPVQASTVQAGAVATKDPAAGRTPSGAVATLRRTFDIWGPIAIFLLFQAVAAIFISILSGRQVAMPGTTAHTYMYNPLPADPGYFGIITNWDGQWYQHIATEGYGGVSPHGNSAREINHTWAFPPGFPFVTSLVMKLGLSFPVAALLVNLVCGSASMVLLYRLLKQKQGTFFAVAGLVLVNSFVTAPLFQAAYSESMALLLLVTCFLLLVNRRYAWAIVAVVALSLVRVITPPFGLVVLVHLIVRWRNRKEDPFSLRDQVLVVVLGLVSAAGAVTWSLLSRVISSTPQAASTRVSDTRIGTWFTETYAWHGWWFPTLIVVLLVGAFVVAQLPMMRGWGPEINTWLWAYPLFLAFVTGPNYGLLRYLLLCFPLLFPVITFLGRGKRFVVVKVGVTAAVGVALQWWWVGHMLVIYPGSFMP